MLIIINRKIKIPIKLKNEKSKRINCDEIQHLRFTRTIKILVHFDWLMGMWIVSVCAGGTVCVRVLN